MVENTDNYVQDEAIVNNMFFAQQVKLEGSYINSRVREIHTSKNLSGLIFFSFLVPCYPILCYLIIPYSLLRWTLPDILVFMNIVYFISHLDLLLSLFANLTSHYWK